MNRLGPAGALPLEQACRDPGDEQVGGAPIGERKSHEHRPRATGFELVHGADAGLHQNLAGRPVGIGMLGRISGHRATINEG